MIYFKLNTIVNDVPNSFCIFSRSGSGSYAVVVVTGLNSGTFDSFTLDVSGEWSGPKVEMLSAGGSWDTAQVSGTGRSLKIPSRLSVMNPVILKLNKV